MERRPLKAVESPLAPTQGLMPGETPEDFGIWMAERIIQTMSLFTPAEKARALMAGRRRLKQEGGIFALATKLDVLPQV